MAYPTDKPSEIYSLREENFAELDTNKIPMDDILFKNGYKNAEESETESVPDAHEQNWLFDILHRNLRYTMGVAEENKTLLANKVATPTTIGQIKVGYGLNVTSSGVLSVDKGIAEDANIISYDLPVGSYMLWAGNNPPEYFIEPAGQTLLRSNYPELWEFAQSNNLVGTLFGEGDGSTTFTVTDIRGNFISIANSNDKVGKFTEAGLPNITGGFNAHQLRDPINYFWGCMTANSGTGMPTPNSGSDQSQTGIGFDASLSNSIYGKSNTVTPANWGLKIILKAKPTPPTNAVPIGTIMNYTGNGIPDGYIIANGAELSRTDFSGLYTWALANGLLKEQSEIPSTAHGFYGTGDGSTTFTIPDLRGCNAIYDTSASGRGEYSLGKYEPNGRKLIDSYISGTQGYNVYSDGYCEQWGRRQITRYGGDTVTTLKTFSNNDYNIQLTDLTRQTAGAQTYHASQNSGNNFTISMSTVNEYPSPVNVMWRACGYLIEEQYKNIKYKNLSGNVTVIPILKY